jgi:hypothetical protein
MDFSEVGIISLMMETVRTSETSVYSETTRRNIPEGSHPLNVSSFVLGTTDVSFVTGGQ